jgi:hypothetical protein
MRQARFVLAFVHTVVLAVPALAAEPTRLQSAAEILGALTAGSQVRAVFHYKGMTLVNGQGQPETAPEAIGGMPLDTFEHFAAGAVGNPEGYLAASHTQLIRHPRHGYVLNYVKVSVYDSGRVKIVAQYLAPGTHEIKMDETFSTEIATAGGNGAAAFFTVP